jgi:hypothetical protein
VFKKVEEFQNIISKEYKRFEKFDQKVKASHREHLECLELTAMEH